MIQTKAQYDVTLVALNDLRDFLKQLGSSPSANVAEIEKLREQLKDLQSELYEYEHSHERKPPSITVDLVKLPALRAADPLGPEYYFEIKFREKFTDYEVHLTSHEVEDLISKLKDRKDQLEATYYDQLAAEHLGEEPIDEP